MPNRYKGWKQTLIAAVLSLVLVSCTSHMDIITPKQMSLLQQGKRYFESSYYKRAMKLLLPLACDGIADAQYAVGYMYYYGYGVAQDPDIGFFWIQRAADQHYAPAQHALDLLVMK